MSTVVRRRTEHRNTDV